ncbi:MAG TPA: hypothetical protein VJL29_14205 [Thermoguttaceae bacterium]|nr:hypothetical protein [Thermoguttaceae bacterium]
MAADADLFPLPLVPFERYMLRDDSAEYPMTFCMLIDFRGEFDRAALEASLDDALPRHPLLCALVERVPKRGDCWVGARGSRPPFYWHTLAAPLELPWGRAIDLRREPGLRLWVEQGGGAARLTLQVHHACADGLGVLHFLGDLLAAYAARTSPDGNGAKLATLDPAALRRRDEFDLEPPEPLSQWEIHKASAEEGYKFFGRKAVPVAGGSSIEGPLPFPGICSHTFDVETTAALGEAAQRHEATLNDVLLRDAFCLMGDWNALGGEPVGRRWMRVNMPTSLRAKHHRRMPAANAMSYTFLARRSADCRDPDALLQGIGRETAWIRYWSLGLIYLGGIGLSLSVPGLFRLATRRRCLASLVLSNLGDPTRQFRTRLRDATGRVRAGNVVLERLTGAPPIRPLTRVSILATRYAGQLTLSALCDPRFFDAAGARAFLGQYVELLERTARA